jgi:hypothetical protein
MAASTRVRAAGIMSVCLLLLSLVGASGAFAAAAAPRTVSPQADTLVIGTGSCVGNLACSGAVGPIGDNSCNGDFACLTSSGSIGDNSCDGQDACSRSGGNVGENSCNGLTACNNTTGNIGDHSCDGGSACTNATGSIGMYSCNGNGVCFNATGSIGDCEDNTVVPAACFQPDARIGIAVGDYFGDNIYDTDAVAQQVGSGGPVTSRIVFYVSVQNDGLVSDSFTVKRSGLFVDGYRVRYYNADGIDVTGKINSGSFTTPSLAPGADYVIRVVVKINSKAAPCSSVTRLVTVSSVGVSSLKDVVRFTALITPQCV